MVGSVETAPSPCSSITLVTALGRLRLGWTEMGICRLRFGEASGNEARQTPGWVLEASRRLLAHLDGHPQNLADLPLDLSGLSPFRRRVAEALRATGPGQILSYGDLALLAGSPGAARAVGQAVKANPILVLVPCHRVVGARGPGGWSAFGSPEVKARLLALEASRPRN